MRNVFAKGYGKIFTEELFRVKTVHSNLPIPMYTLEEYDGSQEITGRFTESELQLATYDVFKIEKVLKRRVNKETGVSEVFVKWLGWPSKHNSWVPASDIDRDFKND